MDKCKQAYCAAEQAQVACGSKVMQIQVFSINILSPSETQEDLNKFLRGHKVLSIQKEYDVNRGVWSFAVEYLENSSPEVSLGKSAEKIDYKEILNPEEFERFAELRKRRKKIAAEEAIPAFAVFTDRELSEMSKFNDLSFSDLIGIDGINKGRASRFGKRILEDQE